MPQKYNQINAMLAVTKASLRATFRSPQSIFFSLFFPVVLIWIFGSLGGNGVPSTDVALAKDADTTNAVYHSFLMNPVLHFINPSKKNIDDELLKGRIAAIIDIKKLTDSSKSPYQVQLRTSTAAIKDFEAAKTAVLGSLSRLDSSAFPDRPTFATVTQAVETGGRKYKMIDFFLPGMIGFALIGSAVFGVSFLFFSLRDTLVLKRMYSTPIKREYIILGEGISKVIFNLMTVVVLIAFGHYAYGFYLSHGMLTVIDMLILSALALLVFMGFGFFISGVSKNQNVIPIYANLFMFPQYFLSGTFFPKSALPEFLQPIIKFLPLTAVNDAMRSVAFEGASLASCWQQVLILVGWGIFVYALTARFFRWE